MRNEANVQHSKLALISFIAYCFYQIELILLHFLSSYQIKIATSLTLFLESNYLTCYFFSQHSDDYYQVIQLTFVVDVLLRKKNACQNSQRRCFDDVDAETKAHDRLTLIRSLSRQSRHSRQNFRFHFYSLIYLLRRFERIYDLHIVICLC